MQSRLCKAEMFLENSCFALSLKSTQYACEWLSHHCCSSCSSVLRLVSNLDNISGFTDACSIDMKGFFLSGLSVFTALFHMRTPSNNIAQSRRRVSSVGHLTRVVSVVVSVCAEHAKRRDLLIARQLPPDNDWQKPGFYAFKTYVIFTVICSHRYVPKVADLRLNGHSG